MNIEKIEKDDVSIDFFSNFFDRAKKIVKIHGVDFVSVSAGAIGEESPYYLLVNLRDLRKGNILLDMGFSKSLSTIVIDLKCVGKESKLFDDIYFHIPKGAIVDVFLGPSRTNPTSEKEDSYTIRVKTKRGKLYYKLEIKGYVYVP